MLRQSRMEDRQVDGSGLGFLIEMGGSGLEDRPGGTFDLIPQAGGQASTAFHEGRVGRKRPDPRGDGLVPRNVWIR